MKKQAFAACQVVVCACAVVCCAYADGHAAGARVAVTDLTLASGASIVCTANDTGTACDLVKVTGDLVTEGAVTVDLGRDASHPLARTFAAKVAEIDGTVTLGGPLSGTGCGSPAAWLSSGAKATRSGRGSSPVAPC